MQITKRVASVAASGIMITAAALHMRVCVVKGEAICSRWYSVTA
ncbi:hypothetical protein ACFRAO_03850 [Streptomyces sp. NPDC056656]